MPADKEWQLGGQGLQGIAPDPTPSDGSIFGQENIRKLDRLHPSQDWSPKAKRKPGFNEIGPDTTPSDGATSLRTTRDFDKMRVDFDWKTTSSVVPDTGLPHDSAPMGNRGMMQMGDFDDMRGEDNWKTGGSTYSDAVRQFFSLPTLSRISLASAHFVFNQPDTKSVSCAHVRPLHRSHLARAGRRNFANESPYFRVHRFGKKVNVLISRTPLSIRPRQPDRLH
jgi:hypothetical protein